MAKLTNCKTCKNEISKSAKVCPHCGEKLKMGFAKKFFLGSVAFFVGVMVLINAANDSSTSTTTTSTKPVASSKPAPAPVELSKEGVSSDVKISVDSFESKQSVGDNEFSKKEAQGVFKIVTVTLTNNQKDAITLDANSFKLIDDQKREFSYSSEAQFALESSVKDKKDSFFLKKLNPGLSATGHIAFDVPKDAKGFTMKASGGFTGKEIELKVE
jgi:hypothetical protein